MSLTEVDNDFAPVVIDPVIGQIIVVVVVLSSSGLPGIERVGKRGLRSLPCLNGAHGVLELFFRHWWLALISLLNFIIELKLRRVRDRDEAYCIVLTLRVVPRNR